MKTEDFRILTCIDGCATLREKIGADFRPQKIPGICDSPLARRALETDHGLELRLPCYGIVEAAGDLSGRVRITNPELMASLDSHQSPRPMGIKIAADKLPNVATGLHRLKKRFYGSQQLLLLPRTIKGTCNFPKREY